MKKPQKLNIETLDLNVIAEEIFDTKELELETKEQVKEWLEETIEDIFIFKRNEKGFESWKPKDYCNNFTQNHFEPYAIKTKTYIVMHDYC